jgi:hypothetical protein
MQCQDHPLTSQRFVHIHFRHANAEVLLCGVDKPFSHPFPNIYDKWWSILFDGTWVFHQVLS